MRLIWTNVSYVYFNDKSNILGHIVSTILETGILTESHKIAHNTPIHNVGYGQSVLNFNFISLSSKFSKIPKGIIQARPAGLSKLQNRNLDVARFQ